jgi:Uma2 family endonuclease
MSGALAWNDEHLMTMAEFRAWPGDGSGQVFDLVNGRVRAQGAPSQTHSTIQLDLSFLMERFFRETGMACRALPTPSVVPAVLSEWNERHPDIAVTCRPNDPSVHEVREPLVIVEILSRTNARDTWDNVSDYMSLPSVREILYLESEAIHGYLFRRLDDGSWPRDYVDISADDTLALHSIGWSVPLALIYDRTGLDPAAPPRRGLPRHRK